MVEVCERVEVEGGVVVGHDGSACAQEALAWAAGLAGRAGLALHVVRAWYMTSAPRPATWEPGYVPPLPDYERAVRAELDSCVAHARLDPAVVVHTHVVHGAPVPALVAAAAHADLLVVGARGHGGVARRLLGSVSDQCVHSASCPVAVVRHGESRRRSVPAARRSRAAPSAAGR